MCNVPNLQPCTQCEGRIDDGRRGEVLSIVPVGAIRRGGGFVGNAGEQTGEAFPGGETGRSNPEGWKRGKAQLTLLWRRRIAPLRLGCNDDGMDASLI